MPCILSIFAANSYVVYMLLNAALCDGLIYYNFHFVLNEA